MIVATVRALKFHGGVDVKEVGKENVEALIKGLPNLERHINNIRNHYGLPVVVAINGRAEDTEAERQAMKDKLDHLGVKIISCTHFANGGKGALELAKEVVDLCEQHHDNFKFVYEDSQSLWDKMKTIAHQDLRRGGHHGRQQGAQADQGPAGRWLRAATRSAWRRRSTRSPPIRSCSARRAATWSTSAKFASLPARSSS